MQSVHRRARIKIGPVEAATHRTQYNDPASILSALPDGEAVVRVLAAAEDTVSLVSSCDGARQVRGAPQDAVTGVGCHGRHSSGDARSQSPELGNSFESGVAWLAGDFSESALAGGTRLLFVHAVPFIVRLVDRRPAQRLRRVGWRQRTG